MTITVVRKGAPNSEYVGRSSPLGNPFRMLGEDTRDYVCDQYALWLREKIAAKNPQVTAEIERLCKIASQGDLKLACFCTPRRCHADFIKLILEEKLAAQK